MTLGQKIKKLRNEKGLTQKDLADQVHVTFQTVSKWEKDENEPDVSTLRELAKLFDCSLDYLLSEDDKEEQVPEVVEPVEQPVEPVTKTIIIHQKELHVCRLCNKDIPEDDLAVEHLTKKERYGRTYKTVPAGEAFYHKECWNQVLQARKDAAEKERKAKASSGKKKSFGWGIAVGVILLAISLVSLLMGAKETVHPALAVLYSILIGYAGFADVYCIVSGSYIGDVFLEVATWSIKFPGIIFSWDLGGFVFLIVMKVLFAIIGFFVGIFVLLLAVSLSAVLAMVSFPFILIHNIRTDYDDVL